MIHGNLSKILLLTFFTTSLWGCGQKKQAPPVRQMLAPETPGLSGRQNEKNSYELLILNDPLKPFSAEEVFEELPPGVQVPAGFVFVPGKKYEAEYDKKQAAGPANIRGYFVSEREISVGEYAAFVEATGYVTEPERFGGSFVTAAGGQEPLFREGTSWLYPQGKKNGAGNSEQPAVHLTWNDALAYCRWAGGRLPSLQEWRHGIRTEAWPSGQLRLWCADWQLPPGTDQQRFVPDGGSQKIVPKPNGDTAAALPETSCDSTGFWLVLDVE